MLASRAVLQARNQPLYTPYLTRNGPHEAPPPHGLSLASLADIAPLARLVEGIRASGLEQVLYAHGPPHSIRDALVVFIAHLHTWRSRLSLGGRGRVRRCGRGWGVAGGAG